MSIYKINISYKHLEMSGKDANDEHSQNILLILITFLVPHTDISGIDIKDKHR